MIRWTINITTILPAIQPDATPPINDVGHELILMYLLSESRFYNFFYLLNGGVNVSKNVIWYFIKIIHL